MMTRSRLSLPALAVLALSACLPVVPPDPEPLPDGDACGASDLQELVGQNAEILDETLLPGPVRVIRPGDAVTMDYAPGRLNIELDAQDRIVRIYCG